MSRRSVVMEAGLWRSGLGAMTVPEVSRGVITLQTAPGDGEVTVVGDEAMGEKDPLLARLLAAATAGKYSIFFGQEQRKLGSKTRGAAVLCAKTL